MLEELRSTKEQRSSFLGIECFADIEKVYDPSEKSSAFPRTYGGFIEDAGLLNDGSLVVVIGAEAALLILFGYERHCVQSSERVSPTCSRRGRLVTRRLQARGKAIYDAVSCRHPVLESCLSLIFSHTIASKYVLVLY